MNNKQETIIEMTAGLIVVIVIVTVVLYSFYIILKVI